MDAFTGKNVTLGDLENDEETAHLPFVTMAWRIRANLHA